MKQTLSFFKRTLWVLALLCVSTSVVAQEMIKLDDYSVKTESPMPLKAPNLQINPSPSILGDLNGDTNINIADVTRLIRAVLDGEYIASGDIDRNSALNVADVTTLIRSVLNGDGFEQDKLQSYLDDVYRSMRTFDWATTGNFHETFGILAQTLMAEVMGDDMIMGAQGSGWFWYEANYNVKQRYTSPSWTSHFLWNSYYTWIGNANYLLAATQSQNGSGMNYIKGQAYAIRAYSYFMLAQWFARTYVGHQNDPCVPIYNGYDFGGSTGNPRSTVSQVYAQIDSDIANAISLLNGTTQQQPHHIGYAVAQGLQARIALVEEDWTKAYNSALEAINTCGKSVQAVDDFKGLNDVTAGNVMWGAAIPTEEDGIYASFWAHMRSDMAYGQRAPKQISKWLYNKIEATDSRRSWWTENTTGVGSDALVQNKFSVKDGTDWDGDYIYMRVEEMYLTLAEAACMRGMTTTARSNLIHLVRTRLRGYSPSQTGTSLGALTTDETGSLREEILLQRRIELWGEDARILTIRRLRQGFERPEENGWPLVMTQGHAWNDPECYAWVMTIPQCEFNGNPYLDPVVDQNPMGDYTAAGQHISFAENTYSTTTARVSVTIPISMTRVLTQGQYGSTLQVVGNGGSYYLPTFNFQDGAREATANFTVSDLEIGRTYTYTVSLSPTDQNSYNPSFGEQITSMTITVNCVNGNPSIQHVSFMTDNTVQETTSSSIGFGIPVTRATTEGEYRASISFETSDNEILRSDNYVYFADGQNQTNVWVNAFDMEVGKTYTAVIRIDDTAGTAGGQYPSTTLVVRRLDAVQAGTANFTDYTFDEGGMSAENIRVFNIRGTNEYYLESPFYYAYWGEGVLQTNWKFYLNADDSITPVEGSWGVSLGQYPCVYLHDRYPTYCYVEQDGNTYTVHYLLQADTGYYPVGEMQFTWFR